MSELSKKGVNPNIGFTPFLFYIYIHEASSVCQKTFRFLAFHHADGFNSHASTANHFDPVEFFFDQFYNCIVLGCCLNKFKKQAVFAVVDDFGFESFCDMEEFYFIFFGAVKYLM